MKRLVVISAILAVSIPGLVFLMLITLGMGVGLVAKAVRDEWNA